MSINTSLLAFFAKNTSFGRDIKSSVKRYQILSVIYLNFTLFLIAAAYEFFKWTLFLLPNSFTLTFISIAGTTVSLLLLKQGKNDAAGTVLMIYMHIINFACDFVTGMPMVGLYAILLFPNFAYFLTPSLKARLVNFVVCIAQSIYHSIKIQEIFKVTLTENQTIQITTTIIVAWVMLLNICSIGFLQKMVEMNLWEVANSSLIKSENLTKEVMQAVEAKDAFVSSLSHEVRNPLNSLSGSIDYLLQVTKNSEHLKVLKNAKLSCEILLNLVNNVLDAAKLKSEKMEVVYNESSFEDILHKVFTINSENFKWNSITAQALIDKDIPNVLWIDSSRLLQILMNLISNAVKFTPRKGEIIVKAIWCPMSEEKENLLKPIKDNFCENGRQGSEGGNYRQKDLS